MDSILKKNKAQLKSSIKDIRDFPKDGVVFKDILPILSDSILRDNLLELLDETLPDDIDVIIAPECRGAIIGALLAQYSEVDFVIARKKGKLPGPTHEATYVTEYSTDTLEIQLDSCYHKKCWFIDDIYATGGTYKAIKDLVKEDCGDLIGGTVLLDVLGKLPSELIELLGGDE